jgi:hypothetical protein
MPEPLASIFPSLVCFEMLLYQGIMLAAIVLVAFPNDVNGKSRGVAASAVIFCCLIIYLLIYSLFYLLFCFGY